MTKTALIFSPNSHFIKEKKLKRYYLLHIRFAEFIEGSPHLTEGEVMEYSHWESFTDDESRELEDEGDMYTDDEEVDAASDENRDF